MENKNTFISLASSIVLALCLIWNCVQQHRISKQGQAIDELLSQVAIHYLDYNDVWTKEDMNHFPSLNGLYDDLNSYNGKHLIEWQDMIPSLKSSAKWNRIITAYSKVSEFGLPAEHYANDGYITVDRYVKTIHVKDSIQRKNHDIQLATKYLNEATFYSKKGLSEFECTQGLWGCLYDVDLQSFTRYYDQSYELKNIEVLERIYSLSRSIIKNGGKDYYRLKVNIHHSNVIQGDKVNVSAFIRALEDYEAYLVNPYTDRKRMMYMND